jgi:hypothetical protein
MPTCFKAGSAGSALRSQSEIEKCMRNARPLRGAYFGGAPFESRPPMTHPDDELASLRRLLDALEKDR